MTSSDLTFKLSGDAAKSFDRDALAEYNQDLGGVLEIAESDESIAVTLPVGMNETDMDNASFMLTTWGFQ